MAEPLTLFPVVRADIRPDTSTLLPLADYDRVLVMFSGGKDSTALALYMLELLDAAGVPRDRLELWHQLVDGAPEEPAYMDWPCTHAYCEAVAKALNVPIRFQWRDGGFLREMLRDGTPTAPVTVQDGHGVRETRGGKGPAGTRRKFPQVSADLSVRWCSAYLKIDVGRRAIARDPRLQQGHILIVTGERREESPGRARYATVERHPTTNGARRVDHWRPILDWPEERVWSTMRAAGIVAHPCYFAGYGRGSCARCIFGGPDEWATARELDRPAFERIAEHEAALGTTIQRRESVRQLADRGELLAPAPVLAEWQTVLMARGYDRPARVTADRWMLPPGAFRHTAGPT